MHYAKTKSSFEEVTLKFMGVEVILNIFMNLESRDIYKCKVAISVCLYVCFYVKS